MTVEQEIAQKVLEVEERRKARIAGIRLETIRTLAFGILDLLDMVTTSTGKEIPVESVNVHYDELDQTWLQVRNKAGIFTADADDSPEVADKMRSLNGLSINEAEKRYLQQLLGKYYKILNLEKGFAVE